MSKLLDDMNRAERMRREAVIADDAVTQRSRDDSGAEAGADTTSADPASAIARLAEHLARAVGSPEAISESRQRRGDEAYAVAALSDKKTADDEAATSALARSARLRPLRQNRLAWWLAPFDAVLSRVQPAGIVGMMLSFDSTMQINMSSTAHPPG